MGIEYTLERTDKKIQDRIRGKGGVANIDNPLHEVVLPMAKDRTPEEDKAVYALKKDHNNSNKDDWLNRTPEVTPSRATLSNIAERIYFEELVKEGVKQYQAFTGEKISYNLEKLYRK